MGTFAAIGLTPIFTLALSLIAVIPLHIGGPVIVGTAVAVGTILLSLCPIHAPGVLRGLLAGLAAVLIYDCTRLPFVLIGTVQDFIPSIGGWLLDGPEVHWSIGYLWRYLGNGAGMGLTFAMICPHIPERVDPRLSGVVFGVLIWTGLLLTLVIAPDGESKMFPLTPVTLSLTLTGHLVYGGVLGLAQPTLTELDATQQDRQ